MRIINSSHTIDELLSGLERKEIVVNRDYQRATGFWPASAKSYFIDTILEGFPFPKLYFYQSFDPAKRKGFKEVVDGQQRLTTIQDFVSNKFRLSNASRKYGGSYFRDLPLEKQEEVLLFSVQVDLILNAERPELLEMFRRMNAYTTPLNAAEKRHAEFQGKFKWFVVDLADRYTRYFEGSQVLTRRQIIRMGDTDLLAEMAQVLDAGIVNRSTSLLRQLYKKYDKDFEEADQFDNKISDCLDHIFKDMVELRGSFMMKDYALLSLFTAMMSLKYGIPGGEESLGVTPEGVFYRNRSKAVAGLLKLAEAHETQEIDGEFRAYVQAASGATTRKAQRTERALAILGFLTEA